MKIWLDAQVSPAIASWLRETFALEAVAVRDLALLTASDHDIFMAARAAQAIVMTKDADFVALQERHVLESGEPLIEIGDEPTATPAS
jgi:predicted nuclease of predicted toxin-antitoxin system